MFHKGHYKIKDHPEIFLEPIPKKQRHTHPAVDTEVETIQLNNIEPTLPSTLLNHSPIPEENNPLVHHDVHTQSHSSEIHAIHDVTNIPQTHIIGHSDEQPTHLNTDGLHHHPNHHEPHISIYSTRGPGDVAVPQITDDQVAAAVDAAIKTVPANHASDFGVASEEAEAAEVALAAGPPHLGNVDAAPTTQV